MMEETGAIYPWGEFNIYTSIDFLKDVAGRISSLKGFVPNVAGEDEAAMVLTEPYGVILGIAPW